ncbi:division plane positioning ATPase MipZ [Azospirillum doebereinerae]|uniref:nucleotide-binding protein n=1 Tax=Azospirillum doebereinerae TaxID=92933 RepID=UPI001EE617C1|nr:chromosome partitioning protein ParA [Azospirillum doebereinerae]
MIITVGGIKGGSGKSLAATNLFIMRRLAGHDAMLVDADDQASASEFISQREGLKHGAEPCVQLSGKAVRDQVRQLAGRYHDIVIDTGGRDTASQRAALTVSDILLLPFQPGNFDVWTLQKVEALVEDARGVNDRLKAVAYISRGLPQGEDNREAAELLRASKVITMSDVILTNRKAYNSAAGEGQAVTEARPKAKRDLPRWEKACEEIQSLYALAFDATMISCRYHKDIETTS